MPALHLLYPALVITTVIGYLFTSFLQYLNWVDKVQVPVWLIKVMGLFCIILHGIWLHKIIDLPSGQNMNFLNLLSFLAWFMALAIVLVRLQQFFQSLVLVIFPLAAIATGLAAFVPDSAALQPMQGHPSEWMHVWLAAITMCFLCIAALQATFLTIQEYLLNHVHGLSGILKKIPPIESMEAMLFKTLMGAFILLTITCASSLYYFGGAFLPPMLQKTTLALIAWGLLAILLMGRYFAGWRGQKAILCTLISFVLLIFLYFGSQCFF